MLRESLITLFLIFSVLRTSSAQNSNKPNRLIYLNYPEYSVKAEILSSKLKVSVKSDFNYTWYAYNKILETKGGYDGRLLNGVYKSFYLNDNLKQQGGYKKGLKSGKWMSWNENGKIKEISSWKNGFKNGNTREFNDNEEITRSVDYKNDVINGYLKIYENRKLIDKKKFRNGEEVIQKAHPKKKNTNNKDKGDDIKESVEKKTEENFIGPRQEIINEKKVEDANNKDKNKKNTIRGEKNEAPQKEKIKEGEKKTFFEKLKGIFSKKQKSPPKKKD